VCAQLWLAESRWLYSTRPSVLLRSVGTCDTPKCHGDHDTHTHTRTHIHIYYIYIHIYIYICICVSTMSYICISWYIFSPTFRYLLYGYVDVEIIFIHYIHIILLRLWRTGVCSFWQSTNTPTHLCPVQDRSQFAKVTPNCVGTTAIASAGHMHQ
jgi:hypothetical protein